MKRVRDASAAYADAHPKSRKVFVVGTGRSGTHFLAESLGAHREVRASVEDRMVFKRVTTMALDPATRGRLMPGVIRRIRWRHAICSPRHYLDKSHPAIWTAEFLAEAFPRSLFVGIQRDVYATVASMLNHPGVLKWQTNWKSYPVPNLFLGITTENVGSYDRLSMVERSALRWVAHMERMDELRQILGDRFFRVAYEDLARDPRSVLASVQEFIGLRTPIPEPVVLETSLEKWRHQLDEESRRQIDAIVG